MKPVLKSNYNFHSLKTTNVKYTTLKKQKQIYPNIFTQKEQVRDLILITLLKVCTQTSYNGQREVIVILSNGGKRRREW